MKWASFLALVRPTSRAGGHHEPTLAPTTVSPSPLAQPHPFPLPPAVATDLPQVEELEEDCGGIEEDWDFSGPCDALIDESEDAEESSNS